MEEQVSDKDHNTALCEIDASLMNLRDTIYELRDHLDTCEPENISAALFVHAMIQSGALQVSPSAARDAAKSILERATAAAEVWAARGEIGK